MIQPNVPAAAAAPPPRITPAAYRPPAVAGLGGHGPGTRRPYTVLAPLLLVVALALAWFLLGVRAVDLVTEPPGATVQVETWPALTLRGHWLLRPGTRPVRASAPGYTDWVGSIEIDATPVQRHHLVLQPLPGRLRVSVAPAVDGELLLGEVVLGTVPGVVADVPAGVHEVEIRAPRYLPYRTTVAVEGKGIEQALAVTLEPGWADLRITSTPAGARVRLDGDRLGTTPLAAEALVGTRVLVLEHDGYKPWQRTLQVRAGATLELGSVTLEPADGSLALSSTPDAATVTLDGEYRGRTPLTLALAPDRAHQLRVLKEGYQAIDQTVRLAAAETRALRVELPPELATVHLETQPATAELLVDGTAHGSASQTLSLPTRPHEITVRAPGYATYQVTLTPRRGVEQRLRIRLKTAAEASAAAQAAQADAATPRDAAERPGANRIRTYAGQELRLFNGGDITLGTLGGQPGHDPRAPARAVALARPFYFGLHEVTNGEYRRFLATHDSGRHRDHDLDDERQPVSGVSWTQAALYCNWLSRRDGLEPFYQIRYGEVLGVDPGATGYRLPTEAEWEFVARARAAAPALPFAWGDGYPPRTRSGNYADRAARATLDGVLEPYDDGFAVAAPVGSFPANHHGVYDLDGNVAEWVHDYHSDTPSTAAARDPLGPATGTAHVVKGASWMQSAPTALHLGQRASAHAARVDLGFRLARYAH